MFKMAQRFKQKTFTLRFVNSDTLIADYEDDQDIKKYLVDEWIFDDLGTEQKANNYGKATEIFKRIIEDRYDKWKYTGLRTHFTTNLDNKEMIERYGERAYDRLKEMCSLILYPFDGSKRGISKIVPITDLSNQMDEEKERIKEADKKRYYDEKKHAISWLAKESISTGINKFSNLDNKVAALYFDCYKILWKADLFEKNGYDLDKIKETDLYKECNMDVEYTQNGNTSKFDLKSHAEKEYLKTMELFKKRVLVKMMDDKMPKV